MAFFCQHYNAQEDIWTLLKNLPGTIVDKAKIPSQGTLWIKEDIGKTAKKEKYTLDDLFFLNSQWIFPSQTPYKEGVSPLSNGNTYLYDVGAKKQRPDLPTFADCVEIKYRHAWNLLVFNSKERKFILPDIKTEAFLKINAFYEKQTPDFANAGDIQIRSLWNEAMAGLPGCLYNKKVNEGENNTNELFPGFVNMVHVFKALTGITIEYFPVDKDLGKKKEWLENALKNLFSTMNPDHDYDFDMTKVTEGNTAQNKKDLGGTLGVTVKSKDQGVMLFSFDLYANLNAHGQTQNIKDNCQEPFVSLNAKAIQPLAEGTSLKSFLLFSKDIVGDIPLFYTYMKHSLQDNEGRKAFVEMLWKKSGTLHKNLLLSFNKMLGHVLRDISWDDVYTITPEFTTILLAFSKNEGFQQTLYANVNGLNFSNSAMTEPPSELKLFPNLVMLDMSRTEKMDVFEFKNPMNKLKNLSFYSSMIKELKGLNNCPNLEELYLGKTSNLSTLVFTQPMEKLIKIFLTSSEIEKLEGLNNCPNLVILEMGSTPKLELIDITQPMNNLISINLYGSGIKELKGLNCPKLGSLLLGATKNLILLEFTQPMNKLENIDLSSSKIKNKGEIKGSEYLQENIKIQFPQ